MPLEQAIADALANDTEHRTMGSHKRTGCIRKGQQSCTGMSGNALRVGSTTSRNGINGSQLGRSTTFVADAPSACHACSTGSITAVALRARTHLSVAVMSLHGAASPSPASRLNAAAPSGSSMLP